MCVFCGLSIHTFGRSLVIGGRESSGEMDGGGDCSDEMIGKRSLEFLGTDSLIITNKLFDDFW